MQESARSRPVAATLALAAAVPIAGLWLVAGAWPLARWLGPPRVSVVEAHGGDPSGTPFDHSRLDALLRAHVDADGLVDYAGLDRERAALDGYLASLATAPFAELGRDEKLALLINAYNAFTLRLILDRRPVASIMDIPSERRWDDRRWRFAGETLSLNQIEHERIRPRFREPRVHFALVCAAHGCPPLRAEAYLGARLEAQLGDQARRVHSHQRWLRFDPASGALQLTRLYDWYASDFLQVAPSIEAYVGTHQPSVRAARERGQGLTIGWLPYDWSLNESARGRRPRTGNGTGWRRRPACSPPTRPAGARPRRRCAGSPRGCRRSSGPARGQILSSA